MVSDGALGELLVMRVTSPTAGWGAEAPPFYAYLQDKQTGATLASIAGGHTLALMEALAGAFAEVDARDSTLQKRVRITGTDETVERTSPDHMMVLGRHASGCVSTLEVIGGARAIPFRLELVGSKGSLAITGRFPGGYQAGDLTLETSVPHEAPPAPVAPGLTGPPANVAEAYARLAGAIRSGGHVDTDFNAAVRLTRLLHAIEMASDQGRRQTIGA
jgi:predicted dehydrogenase